MTDIIFIAILTFTYIWMMYLCYDFGYEVGYSDAWWHFKTDAAVPKRARRKGF